MIDPAIITTTATAIAAVIFNKAIEKGGENLGEAVFNKASQIVSTVRDKFRVIGMEGVLTQAQDNPTKPKKHSLQYLLINPSSNTIKFVGRADALEQVD